MSGNLAEVKSALAAKYERRAKVASSRTKKRKFAHKAKVYRLQVVRLSGR
jgi:hypothetical protein